MSKGTGNFKFKAEVQKLLDILVHSLYTNREIFIRELVSNASDALEKLRFAQQTGREIANPDLPLEISLTTDKDARTLTIADTGIGMTREELVQNLGTIAHSGTAEAVRRAAEASQAGLETVIGQFGVGFYSVFMAAEEVEVTTRSADPADPEEPAWLWKSQGAGTFSISPVEPPADAEVPRGTSILVRLKEDAAKFADSDTVRDVIKRHSNFVGFPISVDGQRVNTVSAIWREPKSQVSKEQYAEFYSFLTHDAEAPLATIHMAADAPIQFNALLFVPPRDLDPYNMAREQEGVDLYVRRVLIQHGNKDILPEYLGFLRGVVDTEDLPLNISRETLQENLLLRKISQNVTKQSLNELGRLAKDDPDSYAKFWRAHGKLFRLGYSDFANRDKIAELLRFNSSAHDDDQGLVSLDTYLERAREGQKAIYYLAGTSRESIQQNPHLELLRQKGIEVLYLTEPIDDFVMDALGTYKDHPLTPAEHADPKDLEAIPDLTPDAKAPEAPEALTDAEKTSFDSLLAHMKEILGDDVTDVRASKRLKDSPVVLVSADGQMTSSMQKIIKMMTKDETPPRKALEVNPDHPIVRNLLALHQADPTNDYVALATRQLLDAAMLLDGYLSDAHGLVTRIQQHLGASSKLARGEK